MMYLNFLLGSAILILGFSGIQKSIGTVNCVNQLSFDKHQDNLIGLIKTSKVYRLPSRCQSRVNYSVEIEGKVTNE